MEPEPGEELQVLEARGVLVEEPVLDVEVAAERTPAGDGTRDQVGVARTAVDNVDEARRGRAGVGEPDRSPRGPVAAGRPATASKVDGERRHPRLVVDLRSVGGALGGELRPVGASEWRLDGTAADRVLAERALDLVDDRLGQPGAGDPDPGRPDRDEQREDDGDDADPLDRALGAFRPKAPPPTHSSTLGAVGERVARSSSKFALETEP